MIRFYLVPVISICVLFCACSNPIASDTDNSPSEPSQAEQIDESESTSKEATKSIRTALDKAQLATEKASKSVQSALDKANKTTQSASKVVEDIMTVKTQLNAMSTNAGNTLTAVQSGDFKTAQQEFTQLQENWNQIKDPVEKTSPEVYQKVDTHVTTINTLLQQPNPDVLELAKHLSFLKDKNLILLNTSKDNQ